VIFWDVLIIFSEVFDELPLKMVKQSMKNHVFLDHSGMAEEEPPLRNVMQRGLEDFQVEYLYARF
jgi:hypothetical protein